MHDDEVPTRPAAESGFAWLGEGSLPRSREDRVAEAMALIALLFSIGVGITIAMLPTTSPSIERQPWRAVPRTARTSERLATADVRVAGSPVADGRCLEGTSPRPCVTPR